MIIRPAAPADLPHVMAALRGLAADLGDAFNATEPQIEQALFGPAPTARAQLAIGDGPMGIAFYTPMFSTMLGTAGCYVSDLWTAPATRGQGLGARLLAAVARDAGQHWQAGFIKLAAYTDNAAALAFYDRLGFERLGAEQALRITGSALQRLKERI